jgi:glycosyltransferase involved in cell wall biosynthesis
MSDLVTVVIPTFNHGPYLGECIDSVLRQTHRKVEIVVVDDASTDDTERVVAARRSPRLRYVRRERRGGVARAVNAGLELARGDFITSLGADDAMKPENLERKLAVFECHPEVGVVHSDAEPVDESGQPLAPSGRPRSSQVRVEDALPRLLRDNPIVASSAVVRRSAIECVGTVDAELRYAEDWDWWIRLAARVRFAYIPERLIVQRIGTTSMQWSAFESGADLEATEHILRKAWTQLGLAERGFSFEDLYSEQYYRKLGNKAEVLPLAHFARLYFHGLRRHPRGAFGGAGAKAAAKLAMRVLLPGRLLRRWRLRRHAARIGGSTRK